MYRKFTIQSFIIICSGFLLFLVLRVGVHHGAIYICKSYDDTLDVNLATMTTVEKYGLTSQNGWWMKDQGMWTLGSDCGIDGVGNCGNVLTTECKSYRMKSTYLFIPIKRGSPLGGFHLSLWSNRENVTEPRGNAERFIGAIMFIRYADFTNDTKELQLSPGGTGYTRSYLDFTIPEGNDKVTSVTIVLTCRGYRGIVKFSDVNVKPIIPLGKHIGIDRRDFEAQDFVESCPKIPSPLPAVPEFKMEHVLFSNGQYDATAPTPVTLVSQLSIDRLDTVVHILNTWEGPVSLSIYIPANETGGYAAQEQRLKTACRAILDLDLGKGLYCDVTFVYGNNPDEYYHINVFRNAAMKHVKTEYLFIVDADFIPSPNFQEVFELVMENNFFHDKSIAQEALLNRAAFVVPAFECTMSCKTISSYNLPSDKEELIDIIKSGKRRIQPFRWENAAGAHSSTDYEHWYITDNIYGIDRYQDKYEPYVVIRKHDRMPVFDERFGSYGMNKVSYIMELKAAGYEFLVLPNCWVTHIPHANTKDKNLFINSRVEELKNRLLRFEFILDLSRMYRFGDCMA